MVWLRNMGAIAAVVMLSMAAFFTVSILATTIKGPAQRRAIETAVADGSIDYGFSWPLGPGTKNTIYNFNDCLIFNMLIIPRDGDLVSRAISPRVPSQPSFEKGGPDGYPPYSQCRDLKTVLSASDGGKSYPADFYHHYLHGDWVVAEILLGFLPIIAASALLIAILLLELGALAAISISRAHGENGGRNRAYATMAVMLIAFWAIPAYDLSFSFAPGDIVIGGFLLLLYFQPPSAMRETGFVAACAGFGVLTAIFELLTGGIPGGLVVILAALAFDGWSDARVLRRRAVLGVVAFAAAIALSFAIKMVLVALIWGPQEVVNAAGVLRGHMGNTGWDLTPDKAAQLQRYGITAEAIRSSRALSTLYGLFKMEYFTSNLAWGSLVLGVAITALMPIVLAIRQGWAWTHQDPIDLTRAAILLLAAAVPLLWCFVFVQHTIASAHFMFRIMIWPAAVLLAAELQQRAHARRKIVSNPT